MPFGPDFTASPLTLTSRGSGLLRFYHSNDLPLGRPSAVSSLSLRATRVSLLPPWRLCFLPWPRCAVPYALCISIGILSAKLVRLCTCWYVPLRAPGPPRSRCATTSHVWRPSSGSATRQATPASPQSHRPRAQPTTGPVTVFHRGCLEIPLGLISPLPLRDKKARRDVDAGQAAIQCTPNFAKYPLRQPL